MKKPTPAPDGSVCYFDKANGRPTEGFDLTTRCKPLDAGDYCYGCEQFICENHSIDLEASGYGHNPSDHARWPDTEEADDE